MADNIKVLVDEWLRLDKNESTRAEITNLWRDGNTIELNKRLLERIDFGTAGLRARMEAGFSRMNDLIVIQASQGLCAYVLAQLADARKRGVVIGHDHRHNSQRWAYLTASVFLREGFTTYLNRGLVHTPLVPFTISRMGAACGVMITASHNPKDDNGYKVYWENAVQIISPHDKGISDTIKTHLEPNAEAWNTDLITNSPSCIDCTEETKIAYFEYLSALSLTGAKNSHIQSRFVSTAMHGVGHRFAVQAFSVFGLDPFTPVKAQQEPDPDFPTVKFPNPEEAGALDLAKAEAVASGASYVLAQDPDADRFSAAERKSHGEWVNFTGDQLGVLLAARLVDHYKVTGRTLDKVAMVASTVSSKMLEAMAEKEGFRFVECLTGFKYIGNTALDLTKEGYEVPFGYEEAIGFMVGDRVRDKDGIAATICFAELVGSLEKQGKTPASYLVDLYARYGFFRTSNSYYICQDPPTIDRVFARLKNFDPAGGKTTNYPTSLASQQVTRVVDLTEGYDSANPPTFKPSLPLSSGYMLQFRTSDVQKENHLSLTIRTSGTEPKIKYYLEGNGKDKEAVQVLLQEAVKELDTVWFEAEKNGLARPGQ